MLRSTSVVITTTGASPLIALSPVSRPTLLGAVALDQVVVLLVRQRLDRRGVEALAALRAAPGARRTRRPRSCRRRSGRTPARRCPAPAPRTPRAGTGRARTPSSGGELGQRGNGRPAARRRAAAYRSAGLRHTHEATERRSRPARSVWCTPCRRSRTGPAVRRAAGRSRPSRRRPVDAVLFDFHGTLAQVEDPVAWVLAAAAACGVDLDRVRATVAGRPAGHRRPRRRPRPARVPPHLAEVWADRDLDPARAPGRLHRAGRHRGRRHRRARRGPLRAAAAAGAGGPTPTPCPPCAALHAAGVPVAVVSNIGFDIRPLCDALGFARYVSAWALSYEVGRCKPDPAIFRHACRRWASSRSAR